MQHVIKSSYFAAVGCCGGQRAEGIQKVGKSNSWGSWGLLNAACWM